MEKWEAGPEVREMAEHLIKEYHHDILPVMDDIVILFREKASKKGGIPVLGKVSKAPEYVKILGKKPYKFIIELAEDLWRLELDSAQRLALLDHYLCACRAEFDEESGEYKCSIAPPDVVGYKDEIERHGMWRPDLTPVEETTDVNS